MNRVLVIEDDPTVRKQIGQLLVFEKFAVREAENGRVGVEMARAEAPDIIVCDIMMPELDGFGVLQSLREYPPTASIPFIFLTARIESKMLRQAMEHGADDYLTKPFKPEALIASVRQRLKRRRLQLEESRKRVEEVGLAVATILPREILETIEHIGSITNLVALRYETQDPQVGEMRRGVQREMHRLKRLIQRLNLYSQLPQLYARRFEEVCTAEVHEVVPVLRHEAVATARMWQREADLQVLLADEPMPMRADYLAILVQELVDNACKFSDCGGAIAVETTRSPGSWILAVTDAGRGMTPDQVAEIGAFKQFWGGGTKPRGLGLGLVLVQGLVRLHGGELLIDSQPSRGTKFSVMIPEE